MLFALAITVVFLLLVALYESWAIPLTVMLIVPVGALGAVLAVTAIGLPNDVYFKVGLITVIGPRRRTPFSSSSSPGPGRRRLAARCCCRSRAPAFPPDHHDLHGVHARRGAAGHRHWRRRCEPARTGHRVLGGMLSATMPRVIFVPIFFVGAVAAAHQTSANRQPSPA
ncbi:efflux RND transporter permease subunit [Klebsiella pneumoniae]|nr:efflux RND transporter permease subunit [Klebsiella pneumoniae]